MPPAGMMPYMQWDMSNVRPWEWWQIESEDWTEAQAVQSAYRDGQADARDEAKGGPEE